LECKSRVRPGVLEQTIDGAIIKASSAIMSADHFV